MQVPPAVHPIWSELVAGKRAYLPEFVAARMLIVRCRMKLTQSSNDPHQLSRLAGELRELYAANTDCPSASRDMGALFG